MNRGKILIVDDVAVNREILAEILKDRYDLLQAKDGLEAMEIVINNAADLALILLDIMMPGMDGYEVLGILKHNSNTRDIPVILITATGGGENEFKGLEAGAADYITKPFYPPSVLRRVEAQLELRSHRLHLEKLVNLNVQKIVAVRDATIDFLASIIEYRHLESGQHVKRTRLMAEALLKRIAQSHKMDREMQGVNIEAVSKAVALHDVGKIGIPDEVLLKPGRLTPEEIVAIRKHTTIGAEIIDGLSGIEDTDYLRACRDIALYHHERWDGKGYPEGLAGEKIPFPARVMAVIDVYDALAAKRVYKQAMAHKEAVELMAKSSGLQFDPAILSIFVQYQDDFRKIQEEYNDSAGN